MSSFDEREKAFENKFGHDQEMQFKAQSRCNKMLGLWAAEKLGMSGADADAYAGTVVDVDFERVGHDEVVEKVLGDLTAKGVDVTEHIVQKKREELLGTAKAQLMSEVPAD